MRNGTCSPRWVASFPRPFAVVQNDLDQVLRKVFGTEGESQTGYSAPSEVWEADDRYHIEIDLPGVKAEQLEVTYEQRELRVRAQRTPVTERKNTYSDRAYGELQRVFHLPEQADPNEIDAQLADGVLHLTVAKRPELQSKKINVRTAN